MCRLLALLAALLVAAQAFAGPAARDLLLLQGNLGPTLNLDFTKGTLPASVAFTRASSATYFDKTGSLQTAANNVARFDYDPASLAIKGLLIEPQSTNGIRNNTMVGASAGTPGTAPTNWGGAFGSNGLSTQIVGTGTENGIAYIDVRFFGTTTALSNNSVQFEGTTQIAAATGQTWTQSGYYRLIAGSLGTPAQGPQFQITEFSSGGANLQSGVSPNLTISGNPLAGQRGSYSYTTLNASCAFVRPIWFIQYNSGVVVDFTLRIGMPQLEQQPFATSPIATSGSAVTRAADLASVGVGAWYKQGSSTLQANVRLEGTQSAFGALVGLIGANASTDGFVIALVNYPTTNQMSAGIVVGGTSTALNNIGNISTTQSIKVAATYGTSKIQASTGGSSIVSGASNGLPATIKLGLAPVFHFQVAPAVWLAGVKYWPRILSAAELMQVTK